MAATVALRVLRQGGIEAHISGYTASGKDRMQALNALCELLRDQVVSQREEISRLRDEVGWRRARTIAAEADGELPLK